MSNGRLISAIAFVVWAATLVTIEYVALVIGLIGAVTGSIALYKALHALRLLSFYETTQQQQIQSIERIASKLPDDA